MALQLTLCGATGRVGKLLCAIASPSGEFEVAAKVDSKNPLSAVIHKTDVIIDFSLAAPACAHAELAAAHKKPIVIGTTGFSADEKAAIEKAARSVPVILSPNMSVGVNVLFKLVETAAKTLGPGYSVEIEETHHVHKKDAPSGTAKKMGEIVQKILGKKPPIQSAREGEVIGDHTIIFGSESEHLAILHRAIDRKVFAEGALRAAKWIIGKSPGLYSMSDVLGLES